MPAARTFTELQFWQRARAWSRDIFHHTHNGAFARDQRLVVQINDSSESVMANMAEGFGRGTQEEFITFLGYSLGSLDETQSHLCAAYDRGYLTKDQYAGLFREGTAIRKLTVAVHPGHGASPRRRPYARQAQELVEPGVGTLRTCQRQTAAAFVRVHPRTAASTP